MAQSKFRKAAVKEAQGLPLTEAEIKILERHIQADAATKALAHEVNSQDTNKLMELGVKLILESLGENLEREGLKDTPRRVAKYYREFLKARDFNFTTFTNPQTGGEMIVVGPVSFASLCEHHLLPFVGNAWIGYIPKATVPGLSKIARTVDHFAHQLQLQERMTNQIADMIQNRLDPLGVGVIVKARHMCMEIRGVEKPGSLTTTSALRGNFYDPTVKAEFLSLVV